MIASPEIFRDMRALGLEKNPAAPRCKGCRGRCEWIHPKKEYCFVCISRGHVKINYPPGPLCGRLKYHLDPKCPRVYMREYYGQYRVIGHPIWDGALIEREFVSDVRQTRITIDGFSEDT